MPPLFYYLLLIFLFFSFFILFFKTNTKNGYPRNWPVLGMLPMLVLNFHRLSEKMKELCEISNGTILITGPWFANIDMLVTSDPANVHYVTTKNFWNYPKGLESKELFDLLGDTLFNLDFENWTYFRRITGNFFKHPDFHRYFNRLIIDHISKGLLPVLDHVANQNLVVDLQDLFKRYTYDAATMITTGFNPRSLSIEFPNVPFIKAIDDACETMFNRHILPASVWKLKRWLNIGREKKMNTALKVLHNVMADYKSKKLKLLKKNDEYKNHEVVFDALKCFLTVNEVVETKHSADIIRDSINGLTFAAYDTSAPTLSWLFWLLSQHPNAEAKIRAELNKNFPRKGGEKWKMITSKEDITKLVYLHASICETLRLYPPVPFQHRSPVKADVLPSGHRVHPKVKIVMSGYAIGRMASVWGDDCLEFKPERWFDGNGQLKYETSAKFFVFNAGPRTCLGKEVAFRMLKAAAANMIYNYNVEVVESRPVIPKASIILQMEHGLRVRLKKVD